MSKLRAKVKIAEPSWGGELGVERAEKVAIASVSISAAIVTVKLFMAFLTGSMAIFGELLDSLGDVLTSSITLVGIRVAKRPPDADHPYGHAKFDSLIGLLSAFLLIEVETYVIYRGLEALLGSPKPPIVNEEVLWILLATAIVNVARSLALWQTGGSEGVRMMQSEALNYGWDAARTLIIAGVLLVSERWPWIDPLAAIVAAAALMPSTLRVAYWSANDLLDRVDPSLIAKIGSIIGSCREIASVKRVRARKINKGFLVDALVEVNPSITAEKMDDVIKSIEERINREVGLSEVLITPLTSGRFKERVIKELTESVEGVEKVHSIELYDKGRRLHLHIALDKDMTLRKIDEIISEVESRLKKALGFEEVTVHMDRLNREVSYRELEERIEGLEGVKWASVKLVESEGETRLEVKVGANPEMHLREIDRLQHEVMALAAELAAQAKVSVMVVPACPEGDTL